MTSQSAQRDRAQGFTNEPDVLLTCSLSLLTLFLFCSKLQCCRRGPLFGERPGTSHMALIDGILAPGSLRPERINLELGDANGCGRSRKRLARLCSRAWLRPEPANALRHSASVSARAGTCWGKPSRAGRSRQYPKGIGITAGAVSWTDQRVVELEMIPGLRTYSVNAKAREPLVNFMTGAPALSLALDARLSTALDPTARRS